MKKKRIFTLLCAALLLFSCICIPAVAATETEEEPTSVLEYFPSEQGRRIISDKTQSPLYQKSALFLGDSICYNKVEQLVDPLTAGWAGRIGPAYDMEWKNVGYSGARIQYKNVTHSITKQLLDERGNSYDLILIEGGINDAYSGVPLGTITEGTTSARAFDTTTYAGSLEYLFYTARHDFPEATVAFMIHYRTPNSLNLNDLSKPNVPKGNPKDYTDLTQEICEKWGVPYLNLYDDDTFNTTIFDTANNSKKCMFADLLHMSITGYNTLNPYIVSFLEAIYIRQECEEFRSLVASLPEDLTAITDLEGTYTTLRAATIAYCSLSEYARNTVWDEYDRMIDTIDAYNVAVDRINEKAKESIRIGA